MAGRAVVTIRRDADAVVVLPATDEDGDPLTAELLELPTYVQDFVTRPRGAVFQTTPPGVAFVYNPDSDPNWGVVRSAARAVRFRPNPGESGIAYAVLHFQVRDPSGQAAAEEGQVQIDVNGPPVVPAAPRVVRVDEGDRVAIIPEGQMDACLFALCGPAGGADPEGAAVTVLLTSLSPWVPAALTREDGEELALTPAGGPPWMLGALGVALWFDVPPGMTRAAADADATGTTEPLTSLDVG